MKRLIVMRHGRAESSNSQGDRFRALTQRGVDEVTTIVRNLMSQGLEWKPDFVLCSNAIRAKQTWDVVTAAWGLNCPLKYDDELLSIEVSYLIRKIEGFPEKSHCALLVGHNPAFESLCYQCYENSHHLSPGEAMLLRSVERDWYAAISDEWQLEKHLKL